MSLSLQSSRLARYSLAATAAAGSGAAAVADVTSGSLSLSFGRSAGTEFFTGFTTNSFSNAGLAILSMGSLSLHVNARQATYYADAMVSMEIFDAEGSWASFTQNSDVLINSGATSVYGGAMVDAGAIWQNPGTGSSLTSTWINQIFWTYSDALSNPATWTNPNATGTKYVNFLLDNYPDRAYGWIQFDWNITDANNWSVTISNWAYAHDGPLAAGSTGTPAVPGLGGLAALAVGAAGVRGRRQRVAG